MPNIGISNEVLTSFTGAVLALVSAGLVWILKSAYEKHRKEILALAKFERIYAIDLTLLKDNFEEIDNWITSLNRNRPYSFYIGTYYLDEEETYKLSNLKLISRILNINYTLRRTGFDLENIYKNYWDTLAHIDSIQDDVRKESDLNVFHNTVKDTLGAMKTNYEPLKNDIIETVALIRAAHRIRKHSLFGYLSMLFVDIYPKITKESIEQEINILKENIARNEKTQHKS